jgi:hypothetical protein
MFALPLNKITTCVEALVQARNCCIRVLSKASSAVPTDGCPSSVGGQCCNIHSPYWVLQTETFWASLKYAFAVAVTSWLHAVDTVYLASCRGRRLSRGSDSVEKQCACLYICAFYKFVCSHTYSVTVAVCDLVWIVPHAVQICSMSFV